ncbi:tape measure protein [Actinobacillus pleuropneumoniae]|uniref:tape measure protein n=1 Tax=Actinobacillus pleuropneumoniae TaxID=715 RepID=UPI003516C51D
MMANNSTSFFVNLAGNVSQQAARFGNSIANMANKNVSSLNKVSRAISAVSKGFNGLGNITIPIVGVGAAAGTAMVGKSMLRTAADFEMAKIRMKQTFGEQGEAADAWLKKFATDTPMAFADTQDAMMRLKTAGIDPMGGALQALVDYNAKVGGDKANLDGYISAISKGFIKGKLSMEEINPLLERNVKVFEILAKETGGKYTADQMQKMLQQGKLGRKSIQALLRGMGRDAAGAAKEQMKTWDGLVSNLEDTWTSMQARFMEHGAFDALKKELGDFVEWLNEKIDDGTLDEFAKTVSDTLIEALKDLKEMAKDVKPVLESIGSVMSWVSEKAGGYGNLAKFMGALYVGNKILRNDKVQTVAGWGWSAGKWGVNKLFRRNKGGAGGLADGVAGALGSAAGVTPVYVTNFPTGFGGGGYGYDAIEDGREKDKKSKKKNKPPKTKRGRGGVRSPVAAVAASAAAVPKVAPAVTTASSGVVRSVGNGVKSLGRGASKAVPYLGTGLAVAEGVTVLMDDSTNTKEKSEAIGSIAGATAGAIVGQALIPIPVVGAAVGSYVGSWLGEWLGSEVGEYLSDPEPIKNELNGKIQVEVKASDQLIATATAAKVQTNQQRDQVEMAVQMGTLGFGGMW